MLPWTKCSKQTASPEQKTGRTKPSPSEKCAKQLTWECPSCSPKFKLTAPRLHFGTASDRPETNEISELPPIPEVVWQQPTETITNQDNLKIKNNDSTLKTNVASQTSPPKWTQPQSHVVTTEQSSGNQTGNESVSFLNCSKSSSTDIQNTEQPVAFSLTEIQQLHLSPLQPHYLRKHWRETNKQTRYTFH